MNLLFVNHSEVKCGVYQYGKNLSQKLIDAPGWRVTYKELSSEDEFHAFLDPDEYDAIFVNYHPMTVPWVTQKFVHTLSMPVVGLMHEFDYTTAFSAGADVFDFRALPDPSIHSRVPNVTTHPRPVPPFQPKKHVRSNFTVGSLGFGTPRKGFERIVKAVQREFDQAHIRFNIPYHFADPQGLKARQIASNCFGLINKPGISLTVTHDFLSSEQLVDFLAENSVNLFLYDEQKGRGISSVIDLAAASDRPFGVSESTMFRHLKYCLPEAFLSENSIRGIHALGNKQSQTLRQLWSDDTLVTSYQQAAQGAIEGYNKFRSRSRAFNTVLDDHERDRYRTDIDEMWKICPNTMKRKIDRANVQQAFVKSTVEHFAAEKKSPSILCVGSFEDTSCQTLIQKGLRIEEIDPAINCDLDSFFKNETTIQGSYDIIFATSVIEHVPNDELFVCQIRDLLAPGGVAVLTMDYKDGWRPGHPKPGMDVRLYTHKDILRRLLSCLHGCAVIDHHYWQRSLPDFLYEDVSYSLATFVFRKIQMTDHNRQFSQMLERERLVQRWGWDNVHVVPDGTNMGEKLETLNREIVMRDEIIKELDAGLKSIMQSTSWKVTAPLRKMRAFVKTLVQRFG